MDTINVCNDEDKHRIGRDELYLIVKRMFEEASIDRTYTTSELRWKLDDLGYLLDRRSDLNFVVRKLVSEMVIENKASEKKRFRPYGKRLDLLYEVRKATKADGTISSVKIMHPAMAVAWKNE